MYNSNFSGTSAKCTMISFKGHGNIHGSNVSPRFLNRVKKSNLRVLGVLRT